MTNSSEDKMNDDALEEKLKEAIKVLDVIREKALVGHAHPDMTDIEIIAYEALKSLRVSRDLVAESGHALNGKEVCSDASDSQPLDTLENLASEIVKTYEDNLQFPSENRFKDLENQIVDALKTLRSKTRKEDAKKIKELRSRIKRIEENSIKLLTTPCIECENLKRELNSPIRLSEKLCKPYEDEIADWKNRAVSHAKEILLLKERISLYVGLIKEALKMGYCSTGWDKKAQAILKKDEDENQGMSTFNVE